MTGTTRMSPKAAPKSFDEIDFAYVQSKTDEAHRLRAEALKGGFRAFFSLFHSTPSISAPKISARPVES